MSTVGVLLGLTAALASIAVLALRRRFLIIDVYGDSMSPAFAHGDRVLARRSHFGAIRRGDVVVIVTPDATPEMDPVDRWHIKRVTALPGDPVPAGIPVADAVVPAKHLVVLGDNARRSSDSRAVGFYRADALIGVVLRLSASRR
jgi:signal peptidase I